MAAGFKVFKKSSPDGKITLYLGKRDFVDRVSSVDPIAGIVVLTDDHAESRKVFGQVVCTFRYGREEDEVMGLTFQKDLHLASGQIFPPPERQKITRLQERMLKKLGPNAYPFAFELTPNAPSSVTLHPASEDEGRPCGLHYFVKIFVGETDSGGQRRRSTVSLGIRKIQFAPTKQGRQPSTVIRKDFILSPGELEVEMTLDKQVYHPGEGVRVSVRVRNDSNKVVKKMKATIQQGVDVVLFQNGQYRTTVARVESQEGCPLQPGSCLQKSFWLTPKLEGIKRRRGVALEGTLKGRERELASSTLLAAPDERDVFGIVVSYAVKLKLFLGALGGEVVAELPMLFMRAGPRRDGTAGDAGPDSGQGRRRPSSLETGSPPKNGRCSRFTDRRLLPVLPPRPRVATHTHPYPRKTPTCETGGGGGDPPPRGNDPPPSAARQGVRPIRPPPQERPRGRRSVSEGGVPLGKEKIQFARIKYSNIL